MASPSSQNPETTTLIGNQDRAGPPGLSLVTTETIPTYRTKGPRREAAPTPPTWKVASMHIA